MVVIWGSINCGYVMCKVTRYLKIIYIYEQIDIIGNYNLITCVVIQEN